ncbi:MAG: hypothetical protein LBJ92_00310 [Holosporales bacterium]|jgi:hypothetical protein|nr:hypothetical protein [Holosporales bacterium]
MINRPLSKHPESNLTGIEMEHRIAVYLSVLHKDEYRYANTGLMKQKI